jgi:hypothetical protein
METYAEDYDSDDFQRLVIRILRKWEIVMSCQYSPSTVAELHFIQTIFFFVIQLRMFSSSPPTFDDRCHM